MSASKRGPESICNSLKARLGRMLVTHPRVWSSILAMLVLVLDYVTGPAVRFPIMYLIPVFLAAWSLELAWAVAFGVGMPVVRLVYVFFWTDPFPMDVEALNSAISIFVLLLFAYLIARVARVQRALSREVKVLEGLLPICMFCKKIRNQGGKWEPLESYITDRSKAQFSHGLCPECVDKHYGDIMEGER